MLGWWISIYQTQENSKIQFASWECGVSGADWLEELCQNNQAEQIAHGGYPNLYQVAAQYIAPWLLAGKIPKADVDISVLMETDDDETVSMQHYGYKPLKLTNVEILRNLPPDTVLTVQVFDLS